MGDAAVRALGAGRDDLSSGPLVGFMGDNLVLGAANDRFVVSSAQMITSVQPILASPAPGGSDAANFTTTIAYDGSSGKWQLGIDFLAGGIPRADILTYTLQDGTKGFLIVALKSPAFKSLTYATRIDKSGALLLTLTYAQGPGGSDTHVSRAQIPHWTQIGG